MVLRQLAKLTLAYVLLGCPTHAGEPDITSKVEDVHNGIKPDGKYYLDMKLTVRNQGPTLEGIGLAYSVCFDADPTNKKGESCIDGKMDWTDLPHNLDYTKAVAFKQRFPNPEVRKGRNLHVAVSVSKGSVQLYEKHHQLAPIADYK